MARAARRLTASTADAPAPAATWQSDRIALQHDGATGLVSLGTVLDVFIFHQGQDFGWVVEGSNDGSVWLVLDESSAPVTGHSPGGKGLTVSVVCPMAFVRVSVSNAGAGAAAVFAVGAVARDA